MAFTRAFRPTAILRGMGVVLVTSLRIVLLLLLVPLVMLGSILVLLLGLTSRKGSYKD